MNDQVAQLIRAHNFGWKVRHHGGKTVRVGRSKFHLKNYLDALKVLTAAGDKQAKYIMLQLTVGSPVSRSASQVARAVSGNKLGYFKRAADALKSAVVP